MRGQCKIPDFNRVPPPLCVRRGCVVFMHGLLEHSLRYLHVFQLLASHGWAVASLDGRGHGLSAGEQGLINDMYEMVADQKQFIALITEMDLAGPGLRHCLADAPEHPAWAQWQIPPDVLQWRGARPRTPAEAVAWPCYSQVGITCGASRMVACWLR